MIEVNSEDDAANVTDDQLPEVDFKHLLETYQRLEFDQSPGSLFTVLLCLMGLKKAERDFSLTWIIENVGTPDYVFFKDDTQTDGDLFYRLRGNEYVGHVRIRDNTFHGFGTVEWQHFETVCLPLPSWHDAVERLKPGKD